MKTINASNVEQVKVDALKTHPNNPRKGDLSTITRSIEINGFYGAIVAQKSTGHILAGNHRYMAAKANKAKEVPVIWIDVDDDEAKRIMLADNRTSDLGGYDEDALAELLRDVNASLSLDGTGYNEADLDALLAGDEPANWDVSIPDARSDEALEVQKKWGTSRGQIWEIGRHRLMCGDSTNICDVQALMGGARASMCFTSPPYNASKNAGLPGKAKYADSADEMPFDDYGAFLSSFMANALSCSDYVFVNIQMLSGNKAPLFAWVNENVSHLAEVLIWDKGSAEPPMEPKVCNSQFEFVFVFSERGIRKIGTRDFRGGVPNVFKLEKKSQNKLAHVHRAVFPVELPAHFICNFTNKGEIVLDLFAGTSTTILAAEVEGRDARGMELSPLYLAVSLQRLEDMGMSPRLINSGSDLTGA